MSARKLIQQWREAALFDAVGNTRIYRDLYVLRQRRCYQFIDTLLQQIDVHDFSPVVLAGILTATAAAAMQLSMRQGFYVRVLAELTSRIGAEETQALLAGLACTEGWTRVGVEVEAT